VSEALLPNLGANINPDPKKNQGISGVERLRPPVAGILIVGLQLR
jgi:hypothetical protein